jgi:hypothetical protein
MFKRLKQVKMKKMFLFCVCSILILSCADPVDKTETAPSAAQNQPNGLNAISEVKSEAKSNEVENSSVEVIERIAGKSLIPTDRSQRDKLFTISKNLTLELVCYKGKFEGRYSGGKVQFDDKNKSILDFKMNNDNIVVTNQNGVSIECMVAEESDLLSGVWYSDFANAFGFSFSSDGTWTEKDIIYTKKGTYKKIGPNSFELTNTYDNSKKVLKFQGTNSFVLSWENAMGESNVVHTRVKKGSMKTLGFLFD